MFGQWIKVSGFILLVSWLANDALAIEAGKLGIKMNANLSQRDKPVYTFTSIVEFDQSLNPPLSDPEIVNLAEQAFNDMDIQNYPKKQKPQAITVLQGKDGRIYIASSIKGGAEFVVLSGHAKVRAALLECQLESTKKHRTGGNCGEQMVTHLFFNLNNDGDLTGAKIVTWGKIKNRPNGIKAPCAPEEEEPIPPTTADPSLPAEEPSLPVGESSRPYFGCAAFIRQLGLVAIEKTPDGNPVPSIARNFDPLPKILDCGL